MYLIFALGNIGEKYIKNRHNVGFIVQQKYIETKKITPVFSNKTSLKCSIFKNDNILFVRPLDFMNNSGSSLKLICDYYKIPEKNVLVLHDDIDLKVGSFKLINAGGSGGHRGVGDIINIFGHSNFTRIKVGVAPEVYNPQIHKAEDFVLTDFTTQELNTILNLTEQKICSLIDSFVHEKEK